MDEAGGIEGLPVPFTRGATACSLVELGYKPANISPSREAVDELSQRVTSDMGLSHSTIAAPAGSMGNEGPRDQSWL